MESMPNCLSRILDSIPERFDPKFLIGPKTSRRGKFTPKSLMMCMLNLCSGRSNEGYHHALVRTFDDFSAPANGSLTYIRSRVSYGFFEDINNRLVDGLYGKEYCYGGYKVIAIDGWQVNLPRTEDFINKGFTGRATSKHRESYLPKGHVTLAYDVLNEVTLTLNLSENQTEMEDARSFLSELPDDAIYLYDRHYYSESFCKTHFKQKKKFVMRVQSNACKEVRLLFKNSNQKRATKKINIDGEIHKIHFIKAKNPVGEVTAYATNLPRTWRAPEEMRNIYGMRWGIETCFGELSATAKVQQWHTKSLNGCLQELWTTVILANITRIIAIYTSCQKPKDPNKRTYLKANFKLLMSFFIDKLRDYWRDLSKYLGHFSRLIKRTTEKRKRNSRFYERVIKSPASPHKYLGSEWKWDKAHSLI